MMLLAATAAVPPAAAKRTTSKEVMEAYGAGSYLPDSCVSEDLHHGTPESDDYKRALKCIRDVLSEDRTPGERAVLLRFAAQLEVELDNFRQAIRDIEASFETGALTKTEKAENYYFLGRLYLGVEPPDYGKAEENLRKFLELVEDPEPDAFFYLGQALAMQGKYEPAIPHAEKAIQLSEKPQENHHRLLLFCHSELENYKQVVSLVERMLTLFSVKDEYLSQLAAAYQELGREREAFLTQAQRYELGFLDTEDELVGIADLYLTYDNPHRAAQILEKEMKAGRVTRSRENLEKLGNMYFLARDHDKALKYLTEAARLSSEGRLDFRIGQVYFERENWKRAERHFRRALSLGGLNEPCEAHVLLAHTLLSLDRTKEALEHFKRAAEYASCRKEAEQWVIYLQLEWRLIRKNWPRAKPEPEPRQRLPEK